MSDFNDFEPRPEGEETFRQEAGEFRQEVSQETSELVEKIKELVRKGNIAKIIIRKDGREFVNVPLNVGIVGGLLGAAAAPWAVIAAAVATAGFDCAVELVKVDGEVIDLSPRTLGRRLADTGAAVADSIRGVVGGAEDAPWEHAPEAPEAPEDPASEAAPWDEPPAAPEEKPQA